MKPQSILVVANPFSGGGRVGRWLKRGEAKIRDSLPGCEIVSTRYPGDATEQVRRGLLAGRHTIVAIGGDGTANEALGGFFDRTRPVAPEADFFLVDAGTGGDFARTIGAPSLTRWEPADLERSRISPIDVGHVVYTAPDGSTGERVFLNAASFGAGGEVVDRVNRSSKRLGGFLTFFGASLRTTLFYRPRRVRLLVDGQELPVAPIFLGVAANGRYFGSGMQIAPQARIDDRQLDMVLLAQRSLLSRIRVGLSVYRGTHTDDAATIHRSIQTLEALPLDPEPILLDVDGEQPGRLPARFRILPEAVRLRRSP